MRECGHFTRSRFSVEKKLKEKTCWEGCQKESLKFISELHFGPLIKRTGCTGRTSTGPRSKVGKTVQS